MIKFIRADLSKASDAEAVIPKVVEAIKDISPISGIVHAAAVTANLMSTTAKSFDIQFATNFQLKYRFALRISLWHVVPSCRG